MILQPSQVRAIRAGHKTQHRLPINEPRDVQRKNGTSYRSAPFRPHLGQKLPISVLQTIDGKPRAVPQCNVLVEDYVNQLLGESITPATVRAEGHTTTAALKAWWVGVYDRTWSDKAIGPFQVALQEHGPASQEAIAEQEAFDTAVGARFDTRHATTAVWVVTFRYDHAAAPRFLAPTGRGDHLGYTSIPAQAIADEPEAIDELTQRRISDDARAIDALRAAGAAEELLDRLRALDTQIVSWRQQVTTGGFNVRDQVRMLQRARDGIEREIRAQVSNRQAAA